MDDIEVQFKEIVKEFKPDIQDIDFKIIKIDLTNGDKIPPLPRYTMAIYSFYNEEYGFLKIDKTTVPSKYQVQDFDPKAKGKALAKSLIEDTSLPDRIKDKVSFWIQKNCIRYDILFEESFGKDFLLSIRNILIEKFEPRYR